MHIGMTAERCSGSGSRRFGAPPTTIRPVNLRIFDSAEEMTSAAARAITQRLQPGASISIGITGGSTPKPLYEMLGRPPLWNAIAKTPVTWVVVDERYVPLDDPQSNAGMIARTLFAGGMPSSHRFLRFRTELNDPARTAAEFENEWLAMQLDTLDLVVLGFGEDGHVASLFPGTAAPEVDDRIATAVFVPRLDQWRVTLTMPVIRSAKLRIVVATGEPKGKVVREVREGTPHPIRTATQGVDTWWFVDRGAAG